MKKTRSWLRWTLLGALLLFVVVQFVPAERSNPPVRSDVDAPTQVKEVLRRACYDCHSHETHWPWYSRVAPASWFVVSHVDDGRDDLNFSDWPTFDFELQQLAFSDICEQVTKGEMPLQSYLLLHSEARLSDADREALLGWSCSGL